MPGAATTFRRSHPQSGSARLPEIIGVAAAVASAFGGQWLLSGANPIIVGEGARQSVAGAMLTAGALLFGVTTRSHGGTLQLNFADAADVRELRLAQPRALLQIIAVTLSAGVVIAFAVIGERPAIVAGWLASIAALLFAQVQNAPAAQRERVREDWTYPAGLATLLIIALVTRVYKLTTLPYNVDGDFASVGLAARAFAKEHQHIFAYGWAGVPMLGYIPPALTMTLFGDGLAGLNSSGVIEGLLMIVGVYLYGRYLCGPRLGLMAAALLTVSYTHLAVSRQSSYIDPAVFLLYALYFLLIGVSEGRRRMLVVSGVLAALCFEMYFSGRIVVPIAGFMLLYLLLFHGGWLRTGWRLVGLWGLAVLITLGPMLVVFVRDSDNFMTRTRQVSILNSDILKHERSVYGTDSVPRIMFEQARRAALLFSYYPDTGTQYRLGVPFLDAFTAPLFACGVGYALFRWRRPGYVMLLGWTALGVLACALTANPPFWPRLIVLLAPATILAALATNRLYELAIPGHGTDRYHIGFLRRFVTVLLLAWLGTQNWNLYVAGTNRWVTTRTRIARYLAERTAESRTYLVSHEFSCRDREFQFLVPGRCDGDLTPDQLESNPAGMSAATLVIFTSEYSALFHRLEQRYPAATAETHAGTPSNGEPFYILHLR